MFPSKHGTKYFGGRRTTNKFSMGVPHEPRPKKMTHSFTVEYQPEPEEGINYFVNHKEVYEDQWRRRCKSFAKTRESHKYRRMSKAVSKSRRRSKGRWEPWLPEDYSIFRMCK